MTVLAVYDGPIGQGQDCTVHMVRYVLTLAVRTSVNP